MSCSINGLKYYNKFREWAGNINVNCSQVLFNKSEISLKVYIKCTDKLTKAEYNTLNYIMTNFNDIYETVLNVLYKWYKNGKMASEIFNEDTSTFMPVEFNSYKDLHRYIGTPCIQILHQYIKDEFAYFTICFNEDCLLSIEHGLTALFHKSNMIDIDATYTEAVIDSLKYYEEDCTLWKTIKY